MPHCGIALMKEDDEEAYYKACGETEFLLRYPEEWDISIEKEEE